jgi:hypothetical protein
MLGLLHTFTILLFCLFFFSQMIHMSHTYKTNDRVTRTPLKTGGELRFSGRVSSTCSTSGTRRVNLVTNSVISRAASYIHYFVVLSFFLFPNDSYVLRSTATDSPCGIVIFFLRWIKYEWCRHIYENVKLSSNTNPSKNRGWTQVLRKSRQFLLH